MNDNNEDFTNAEVSTPKKGSSKAALVFYPIAIVFRVLLSPFKALGLSGTASGVVLVALSLSIWVGYGVIMNHNKKIVLEKSIPKQIKVEHLLAEPYRQKVILLGKTKSGSSSAVVSEINGKVLKVYAKNGAHVEKGDVILKVDASNTKYNVAKAKAALQSARLSLQAERRLMKQGFSSKKLLADKLAAFKAAESNFKQAKDVFGKYYIKSPIAGTVNNNEFNPGDFVSAGHNVAMVVSGEDARVKLDVSLKWLPLLQEGTEAEVTLDKNVKAYGRIASVGNYVDPATGTVKVEVNITVPEGQRWISGASVELNILMPSKLSYHVSPASLTLDKQGNIGVYVVEGGKAKFKVVEILNEDDTGSYISGLPEEVNMITIGNDKVHPNMDVADLLSNKAKPKHKKGKKKKDSPHKTST